MFSALKTEECCIPANGMYAFELQGDIYHQRLSQIQWICFLSCKM
jgi:hypothetical protein